MSHKLLSITLMLCLASCVNRIDRMAWQTLSEIEGQSFSLSEMTWEETMPILSVRISSEDVSAGKDILQQRMLLHDFHLARRGNECSFSISKYDKQTGSYSGDISIAAYTLGYMVDSGFTQKPSEIIAEPQGFGLFYIPIEYTVSKSGELSFTSYNKSPESSGYTQEIDHLSCEIEEFTGDSICVVFPDYLLPDFITDCFYTGKVRMVFKRND